MFDPLKNFSTDKWYKLVLAVSLLALLLAITMPLQVSNSAIALIALGSALIGLGEWINHPYQVKLDPHMRFKIEGHPRNNSALGVILVIAGIGSLCFGIWRLI